ncbi:IreB family regulatory phosphoprotein [Pisciglobus halotolerans]|uniref:UPF0297 protein SAMN04489868_1065 n=1 Tax=Pisciglobus halotolerans TaxID=745365 RepID=A0A1I3BER9_9LACT|nr:IreB family regulatory phosphoprotein [Pisciglobus halotolerans]SFH60449.1 Uncharacterized protein, UPF0297 family [Pisciglobus halotolerans]
MGSLDETVRFNVGDNSKKDVKETLSIVYTALNEKGYNSINQIVGYLLSGDPAYIPRHKDARNLIKRHERDEIVEELVKSYLKSERKDI